MLHRSSYFFEIRSKVNEILSYRHSEFRFTKYYSTIPRLWGHFGTHFQDVQTMFRMSSPPSLLTDPEAAVDIGSSADCIVVIRVNGHVR